MAIRFIPEYEDERIQYPGWRYSLPFEAIETPNPVMQRPNFPSIDEILPPQIPTPPNVYAKNYPAPIPINPAQRLLPEENIPVPQYENYRPSRGRTVLNAIAGGLAGAAGGPIAGLQVGERLRDTGYRQATEDYQYKTFDRKRRLAEEEERFKRGKEETELGVKHEQNEALNAIKEQQNELKQQMNLIQQQRANTYQQGIDNTRLMNEARTRYLGWLQDNPDRSRILARIYEMPEGPEKQAMIQTHKELEGAGKWQAARSTDPSGNVWEWTINPVTKEYTPVRLVQSPEGQPIGKKESPGPIFQIPSATGESKGFVAPKIGVTYPPAKTPSGEPARVTALPPTENERRGLLVQTIKEANQLRDLARKPDNAKRIGFGKGWWDAHISKRTGNITEEQVLMHDILNNLVIRFNQAVTGQQIGVAEMNRLREALPSLNTPPHVFYTQLDRFIKATEEILGETTGGVVKSPLTEQKPKLWKEVKQNATKKIPN